MRRVLEEERARRNARLEVQMEKLKLAKEQRCILHTKADIIQNTRKATKEIEVDNDLLKKREDERWLWEQGEYRKKIKINKDS